MRSVLVCGVGQIGTFAARSIAEVGARVVALDVHPSFAFVKKYGPQKRSALVVGDVMDQKLVEALISDHSIDTIVLSIGLNSEASTYDDDAIWKINVCSSESVALAARKKGATRIVFLSSFAVYGGATANLVHEETPLNPQSVYGRAKAAAEITLMRYRERELDVRILRPCGIYGPRPAGVGSRSARLIDSLLVHAIQGTPLTVSAPREGADEYLYVKDVSRAIALLALQDTDSSDFIFNVGSGKKTTVPDLLSAVEQITPTSRFRMDIAPTNGSKGIPPLDVSRIRKAYGFEPRYRLAEGLADYLKETSVAQ
jgi:UDP-glucose 4-epimerase